MSERASCAARAGDLASSACRRPRSSASPLRISAVRATDEQRPLRGAGRRGSRSCPDGAVADDVSCLFTARAPLRRRLGCARAYAWRRGARSPVRRRRRGSSGRGSIRSARWAGGASSTAGVLITTTAWARRSPTAAARSASAAYPSRGRFASRSSGGCRSPAASSPSTREGSSATRPSRRSRLLDPAAHDLAGWRGGGSGAPLSPRPAVRARAVRRARAARAWSRSGSAPRAAARRRRAGSRRSFLSPGFPWRAPSSPRVVRCSPPTTSGARRSPRGSSPATRRADRVARGGTGELFAPTCTC